eukprot:TRINITY_DN50080_c0_g1_i1.p2 TRINITY_DN50080_c0_g1~~TRINITY_DN50080_c0_g1_i1.p2  ORF type:complete len:114 (+),score=10.24 TRINITY_DN50080_c0_g1_i1:310-651(+)
MPLLEASRYRISQTAHLIGIYLVRHLEHQELIKEIQQNFSVPPTTAKELILKQFHGSALQQQLVVCEKIQISLVDPLSKGILDIPVRGLNCKHLNCFSLKNYLISIDCSKPRY